MEYLNYFKKYLSDNKNFMDFNNYREQYIENYIKMYIPDFDYYYDYHKNYLYDEYKKYLYENILNDYYNIWYEKYNKSILENIKNWNKLCGDDDCIKIVDKPYSLNDSSFNWLLFYKNNDIDENDMKNVDEFMKYITKLYVSNDKNELLGLGNYFGGNSIALQNTQNLYGRLGNIQISSRSDINHIDNMKLLLKIRKSGIFENDCINSDIEIDNIRELEKDIYNNIDTMNENEIKNTCSKIIWGPYSACTINNCNPNEFEKDKESTKLPKYDDALDEIKNHMNTIKNGLKYGENIEYDEKQRIFGYRNETKQYFQYHQYFHATNFFKLNDKTGKPCNPLVQYTIQLNNLANYCSAYGKNKFIRFLFEKGRISYHSKFAKIEHLNDHKILGVMTLLYLRDLSNVTNNKPNLKFECLYFLVVYPKSEKLYPVWHGIFGQYVYMIDIYNQPLYQQSLFNKGTISNFELESIIFKLKKNIGYVPKYNIGKNYVNNLVFVYSSNDIVDKNEIDNLTEVKYFCFDIPKKTNNETRLFVIKYQIMENSNEEINYLIYRYNQTYIYKRKNTDTCYIVSNELPKKITDDWTYDMDEQRNLKTYINKKDELILIFNPTVDRYKKYKLKAMN